MFKLFKKKCAKFFCSVIAILIIVTISLNALERKNRMEDNIVFLKKLSEFDDMNYYILCDTAWNEEVTDIKHVYEIYGGLSDEMNEGQEMYQKFKDIYFNSTHYTGDELSDIVYISIDGKWIIIQEQAGENEYGESLRKQMLYYNGDLQKQIVSTFSRPDPIIIVKAGDEYKELEDEKYAQLVKMESEYYEKGYRGGFLNNENGSLITATNWTKKTLDVWENEEQKSAWSISMESINDDGIVYAVQFYGDEKSGVIVVKSDRNFYEVNYPSGDIRFLGKDMYSFSYSPDMKYIVYSSIDNEAGMELEPDEIEKEFSGIYVKEIKSGETAYIGCDNEWWRLNGRKFYWVDKKALDQYLSK